MLATVASMIGGFLLLIRVSYRRARSGEGFHPAGKLRWGDSHR